MCSVQATPYTLRGWLRDPMIRLMMESDGVTEHDMIDLVRRVAHAAALRPPSMPPVAEVAVAERQGTW